MPRRRPFGWKLPKYYANIIPSQGYVSEAEDILGTVEGQRAADEMSTFAWGNFVQAMESGITTGDPRIGIFWVIGKQLLTDVTPLLQGGEDGQFLVPGMDHFSTWENWQRFSPKALAWHGLPPEIAWTSHENHPRGRVVFCWSAPSFIIYADQCSLDSETTMNGIVKAFGLDRGMCLLRCDKHYQTFK